MLEHSYLPLERVYASVCIGDYDCNCESFHENVFMIIMMVPMFIAIRLNVGH